MTLGAAAFVDTLQAAATSAEKAEEEVRREAAGRIAAVEQERAFAFRRLNLMRALADAMAPAEEEEIAVAAALAGLRSRLGWSADSEARGDVLARFAPVAQAMFRNSTASDHAAVAPIRNALADFEDWYAASHPAPFWALFDHYIPETPLVDF